MLTIAVANRKGGVGKSTVAGHLAGELARRGHKVLLADTDPQGHAGLMVGVPKDEGLYNLLVDNFDWQDVLRPVQPLSISPADEPPAGALYVLPSDRKTQIIASLEPDAMLLANRLEEIEDLFDYVILDTAPTVTTLDSTVYMAAKAFLYVTECERLSLDGLANGLKQVQEFARQRANPRQVLGIIPNKLRQKTNNHLANLESVQERFNDLVWEAIPQVTALSEASNFGKLIFSYRPGSEAANIMQKLADRFEERVAVWQS
jgi:chromosome partitioning protein